MRSTLVYDHLGNQYKSLAEMCNVYGIGVQLFRDRIRKGHTVEEALTNPYGRRSLKYRTK